MNPKGKETITLTLPFEGFGERSNCDEAHTETLMNCVSDDGGTPYADLHDAMWRLNFDMDLWCRRYAEEYADGLMCTVLGGDANMWTDYLTLCEGVSNVVSIDTRYLQSIEVTVTRDIAARIRKAAGRCRADSDEWRSAIKTAIGGSYEPSPSQLCDFEPEWCEALLRAALSRTMGLEFDGIAEYYLMEGASGNGYYDNWFFESLSEKDRKKARVLCNIASRRRDREFQGVMQSAGIIPLPLFALPLFRGEEHATVAEANRYLAMHPMVHRQNGMNRHVFDAPKLARIAAWGGLRAAAVLRAMEILASHGGIGAVHYIEINLQVASETGLGIHELTEQVLYDGHTNQV